MHPAIITWCGVGFFAEYPEPAGFTSEGIFLMWAAYFYHLATWGVFLTSCCSPFFQSLISFDMTLPWVLLSFPEPHVSRTISRSAAGSKPSPICLCCGSIWFLVPSTSAFLSTHPALTGPVSYAQLLYPQWGHKTVSGPFEQQCPKVLTPGTSFMKHIFFSSGAAVERLVLGWSNTSRLSCTLFVIERRCWSHRRYRSTDWRLENPALEHPRSP